MQHPAEPAKIKAAATYNAASDHFDDEPLAFWDRYGRLTVERLALPVESTVLDVGCGSGASAVPAASIVAPAGRVIGVDLAERLLELARDKAKQQNLRNVEFRYGDMEALGFPDGTFDAVISVFSVFFVPDMKKQVAELWRMMRPGGQLAITTWGPRMFEPGSAAWWNAVKVHALHLHSAFTPWERITTVRAVRDLLIDAGVRDPAVVAEAGRQTLRTVDDWWMIVMGSGYRWTVDPMNNQTADRVREDSLRQLRDCGATPSKPTLYTPSPERRLCKRPSIPNTRPHRRKEWDRVGGASMIELLVSRPTQPIGFIIAPSVLARANEEIV